MQYEMCIVPEDKNCLRIEVRQRLIKCGEFVVDGTDSSETVREELMAEAFSAQKENREARGENLFAFYELVTELPGMNAGMMLERYAIVLEKAELFSWDDLMPEILAALEGLIAEDHKLEKFDQKASSPKKPGIENKPRFVQPKK